MKVSSQLWKQIFPLQKLFSLYACCISFHIYKMMSLDLDTLQQANRSDIQLMNEF
jgi:hypothetical protein